MNIYETMSTVLSSGAIIISIVSYVTSRVNMIRIEKTYYGQSELLVREAITNAKNRITDILSTVNSSNNQYTKQRMDIAVEQLLKAYEEACAKYIDIKIDKKRFKKTYIYEIKEIVESDDFKEYFQFGSQYGAIKKVYKEWFY